jgi:hypothetical protein
MDNEAKEARKELIKQRYKFYRLEKINQSEFGLIFPDTNKMEKIARINSSGEIDVEDIND